MCDSSTYNNCLTIIDDKKTLSFNDLNNKWNDFKNKFPKLYEMLTITDNVDLNMLKFLCDSAQNHQNKTKNEQLETDFAVSEKLGKQFIFNGDKFSEPSELEKEKIKEKLRNKLL